MKTKILLNLALAASFIVLGLASLIPPGQQAQAADLETIQLNRELGYNVNRHVVTDQSVAMRIKWIGTGTDATIEINAGGDIAFTTDGSTADTTLGLPTSNGTIDVSDATANTFGEVCDEINSSANWQCILVDVRASLSSNNTLTDIDETAVTTGLTATYDLDGNGLFAAEGLAVTVNTADVDELSANIGIEFSLDEILSVTNDNLLNRTMRPVNSPSTVSRWRSELTYVSAQASVTTGSPDLEVYLCPIGSGPSYAGQPEIRLWSEAGTTIADGISTQTLDLRDLPAMQGASGARLIVVFDDDSTPDVTAGFLQISGLAYEQ
jgi:hypothetical protein